MTCAYCDAAVEELPDDWWEVPGKGFACSRCVTSEPGIFEDILRRRSGAAATVLGNNPPEPLDRD